ncbi:MAG: CDP-glycerol glycerophosphotransferase family protein [Solirubrobacteraceae bacterium]
MPSRPQRWYSALRDPPAVRLESLEGGSGRIVLRGLAYIARHPAALGRARILVRAVPAGAVPHARLLAGTPFHAAPCHRPDANHKCDNPRGDLAWAGFDAALDAERLPAGDGREWDLWVIVRAGPVLAARRHFPAVELARLRATQLALPGGAMLRAFPTADGQLRLQRCDRWFAVGAATLDGGRLELSGMLHGLDRRGLELEAGGAGPRAAVSVDGLHWSATLDMAALPDDAAAWPLRLRGEDAGVPVLLPPSHCPQAWDAGGTELALVRSRQGTASLRAGAPHAVLEGVRWAEGGGLELTGTAPCASPAAELVLASATSGFRRAWPLELAGGRFKATITPAAVPGFCGPLPLPQGRWELAVRAARDAAGPDTAIWAGPGLRRQLPPGAVLDGKPYELRVTATDKPVLDVGSDLAEDERGAFNQRRLRTARYAAQRAEPLRQAVVYASFRGRQYSDSPRAIHEALVALGTSLEHLWLVKDGETRVPETARAVRDGSKAAYDAFARSRFVVVNDHFPEWFRRRPDQVCVQTWHGTPLKRLGFDVSQLQGRVRKFEVDWPVRERNWQYVLSPSRFATPILRDAYRLQGEMLETGYPRVDVLTDADPERRGREVRARLGIPADVRTVLYAPTFRDTDVDERGHFRMTPALDLERARSALGEDTVLLVRRHHYVVDDVPASGDGRIRDVSAYPDGTELLLATDVLVTDYSSISVDFANTGRPMLFFTYDLEEYRERVRGFYVDFERTMPGPLLRTSDDVIEAIRDAPAIRAAHASRYDAFVERFCEFDDGGASRRVIERIFA